MNDKLIQKIANFLTDDPDIFVESARKPKRPKPDKLKIGDSFETEDALEDKSEPADPKKKTRMEKSGLNKLTGAKATPKKTKK